MDNFGETPKIFGKILREARLSTGMGQDKLAEAAGIDKSYVSLLEQGKRQPSIVILLKLSLALKLLPEDIIKAVRLAHAEIDSVRSTRK